MGVIKISELPGGYEGMLGIWDLSEPCSALVREFCFSEKELLEYNKITNDKRKCEFLAVRLLLQKMMQKKKEISYTDSGKPILEENIHISISHSSELVVVLLTAKPAGIDVESIHRKTDKIAARYLSESELRHIDKTQEPAFTRILYWCAKEALFKCTPLEGINFKNQLLLKPFLPVLGSGNFYGQLIINNQLTNFVLYYSIINNNAIVYCFEKDTI
jgi:4'-phosphopantetheinyl transferase